MHISVREILGREEGYRKAFNVSDEWPELEDVKLVQGVGGEVTITRSSEGLLLGGQVQTAIKLECHRCLRTFDYPVQLSLLGEFRLEPLPPDQDLLPIERDFTIDLAPLLRQEAVIATPIKQLCRPDCPGLCSECGELLETGHNHTKKN